MALNKGFSLDFKGFLDFAEDISNISDELLLDTTKKALEASRDIVNIEIGKAMKNSKFSFKKGEKFSQGTARASLIEIDKMPIEIDGTEVTAYAGVDLEKAPEVLILSLYGTPNETKDTKLYHAVAVKGKVRNQVNRVQEQIFSEALKEALKND
jgi:hypothetical protein